MNNDLKPGTEISFNAKRILDGNPVTGIFVSDNEEWITVKLTKDIEGLTMGWCKGEEKTFRKSLIGEISIK